MSGDNLLKLGLAALVWMVVAVLALLALCLIAAIPLLAYFMVKRNREIKAFEKTFEAKSAEIQSRMDGVRNHIHFQHSGRIHNAGARLGEAIRKGGLKP